MNWEYVHKVWALDWCPRKLSLGAQTLCMALLFLAATTHPSRADCPAAPIADPDDMAISFLASNGVQAASASLLASTVKEGIVVYDDTNDVLKLCDGTNWIEVGSGSGTDTLASLSCTTGQIAKFDGTAWACAADGGGSGGTEVSAASYRNGAQSIANSTWTILTMEAEEWDSNNMVDIASHPTRITIPAGQSGEYLVTAYSSVGTNASGGRWLSIYRNGSLNRYCNVPASSTLGGYQVLTCPWMLTLSAGDYLELGAYQNSGGALDFTPRLAVSKILGGGSDTLSNLSCSTNEIPKWNGSAWACAADGNDGGASMTGAVMAFNASTCPTGWTEFTPARGRFLRGIDNGAGNDPDGTRAPGDIQADEFKAHSHVQQTSNNSTTTPGVEPKGINNSSGLGTSGRSTLNTGGAETRPKNVAVIFCQYNGTGGLGGGGSTTASYLHATGPALSNIAVGTVLTLSNTMSSTGTDISLNTGNSRFTLKAGNTYRLMAQSMLSNSSPTGAMWFQWYDVTGSAAIGTGGYAMTTDHTSTYSSMPLATAYITPSVDTDVELRISSASPATTLDTHQTYAWIETLGGGSGADTLAGLSCALGEIPKWDGTTWACAADGAPAAAGDTGQIQFNDGSDDFAADAALHWDNTNKRLGIGTATAISPPGGTPGRGLMLHGDAAAPFLQISSPQTTTLFVGQISFANSAIGATEKRVSMVASRRVDADDAGSLEFFTRNSGSLDRRLYIAPDGGVAFGSGEPDASSLLDLTSTTKGFLPPRMDDAQRDAIASPATGLMIFNTTAGQYEFWSGTAWTGLGGAGVPTGIIAAFASATCPTGWTEYVESRGRFLRGIDNGAGNDPDGTRAPGNIQGDALQNITGSLNVPRARVLGATSSGAFDHTSSGSVGATGDTQAGLGVTFDASRVARTADETRPKNVAVLFCQYAGGAPLTATPSGAAGEIQYSDGAGGLTSDANIVVSGGKVGIGTTSPTSKLEISAAGSVGMRVKTTDASGLAALSMALPGQHWSIIARGDFGGSLHINDDTAATARLVINTSGNIGIGTASPAEKLDLGGGNIKMGYQQITNNCASGVDCVATCPAGKYVISGGCWLTSAWASMQHEPNGNTAWHCMSNGSSVRVTAICANIR